MKNKLPIILATGTFLFILLVSFLAYKGLIPTEIKSIPYYDSIGHFMLFGILGYVTNIALKRRETKIFRIRLPIGPSLVAIYAIADEAFQVFSNTRTFDLFDLGFGLLGIFCFYKLDNIIKTNSTN